MNWTVIAAAALLWSATGAAAAVGRLADVTIYDRGVERTLAVYRHEGNFYVVGRPGSEYEIRVRNRTGAEILAVVSVDGVNAVSGETANWHQTGYVLAPYQTLTVKGWRKSLQQVAAFYFTRHANSYAARTGRPQNVGVIGVAVFRKRAEPDAWIDQRSPWPSGPSEESPFPDDTDAVREGNGRGSTQPAPFGEAKRESADANAGAVPEAARAYGGRRSGGPSRMRRKSLRLWEPATAAAELRTRVIRRSSARLSSLRKSSRSTTTPTATWFDWVLSRRRGWRRRFRGSLSPIRVKWRAAKAYAASF